MSTLAFLPHQIAGADFLLSRERGACWDEMGTGKTGTAIAAIERAGFKKVMIVCPAAVRQVWAGELRKFSARPLLITKATSIDGAMVWQRGKSNILLCSYEHATKWGRHIDDLFDALILDEAHYLKTWEAQRTRAILGTDCDGRRGLARFAGHTWFLTGTPMPNDPADIWPYLRFTGGVQQTRAQFIKHFFNSYNGTFSARNEVRSDMADTLRDVVFRNAVKRTKIDIGLSLPPIWLTTTSVDGDAAEIRSLLRDWPGLEDAIVDAVEKGGLSFLDAQHIATLRRLVGEAKAPAYVELAAEELHSGLDKLVVMGVHTEALKTIRRGLEARGFGVVMLTGETPEKQRIEAVRSFQEEPAVRVFVGNVRAAGTGLTLTAASRLDMFESSWTPADNAQALMRVHRLGQERRVEARFVSLADSIDDVVTATVARKTAAIAKIGIDFAVPVA